MTNEQPTHLDLFSGIGGFALAAKWAGFRTIGFCEIDEYCQRVLAKNFLAESCDPRSSRAGSRSQFESTEQQSSNSYPEIISDIRELDGKAFRGVDLITGGFPCQPFSCAGKRRGKADDRHLWPEMLRVIKEARPAWVLGENVAGIIGMELDSVLSDLEAIGYACRPFVIPACGVDARHRRNRVWIVGYREQSRLEGYAGDGIDRNKPGRDQSRTNGSTGKTGVCRTLSNAGANGRRENFTGRRPEERTAFERSGEGDRTGVTWLPEPDVGFCPDGIPAELDGGIDATTCLSRSSEVLLNLWERVASAAVQRTAGGQWRIPTTEVLLAGVHGEGLCQRHIGIICQTQAGYEVPWELLRIVWGYNEPQLPSYRRELGQRLAVEHPDLVRLLSYYPPPPCSACWRDNSWENGMPRVAHGIKHRVDRLKGLGNAIVPQVAFQILKAIREMI